MTDAQFKSLVDLHMFTVEMNMRTEAKVMAVLQMCSMILESQHAGVGSMTPEWIANYIVKDFDRQFANLEERYQPEIDRIMQGLRD